MQCSWRLCAMAAAASLVVVSACSSAGGTPSASKDATFNIGVVTAQTGTLAQVDGDLIVPVVKAFAAYYNKQGGILGHQIKLYIRDDGSSVEQAASAIRQLTQETSLDAVIPDYVSAEGLALLPVTNSAKVITMEACITPDCWNAEKYPYNFNVNPPPSAIDIALADYVKANHVQKVGIIADDDTSGQSFASAISGLAKASGFTIVGTQYVPAGATSVATQLAILRSAGAQALAAFPDATPLNVLMSGVQETGWKAKVICPNCFNQAVPVAKLVPGAVAKQLLCVCDRVGARQGDTLPPVAQELSTVMKAYGGLQDVQVTALVADMMAFIRYAYQTAGKLDPSAAVNALNNIGKDTSLAKSTQFYLWRGINVGFTSKSHLPLTSATVKDGFALEQVSPEIQGTYVGTPLNY